MPDKFQTEATRTFMRLDNCWAEKLPDLQFKDRQGRTVKQAEGTSRVYPNKGRPDMYYMLYENGVCYGGFVEVKTGQGDFYQRFAYDQWREDQKEWYDRYAVQKSLPVWFFLVMGASITDKKYPRVAFLFPAEKLQELEATDDRESLSYKRASEELATYSLKWAKKSQWDIPEAHPFWKQSGQ